MSHTKVFVTGASGFVGLHLVKFLLEAEMMVVACLRQSSDQDELLALENLHPKNLTIFHCDISQTDLLAQGMSDSDCVVHTAARIEPIGKTNVCKNVNVDGTKAVLDAAKQAKVKQLIHLSSLSVITGEADCYALTEEEPYHYSREIYANSKIDAERLVMEDQNLGALKVTALRPGFIYGAKERHWMPQMIKAFREHRVMMVGDGSKETNVVFVENLCRAIALSLLNPKAYGQIFNITDGQRISKRQLFDTICDAIHEPRVKISVPPFVARLVVEAATIVSPASRSAYRLFAVNQGFSIAKAERELNYTDRINFATGMASAMTYFSDSSADRPSNGTSHTSVEGKSPRPLFGE